MSESELFELQKIARAITPAALVFEPAVESTNTFAREQIASGRQLPFLVLCDRQTAGRGTRGKTWYSGRGSLTCSLVVSLESDHWPLLPLLAGVAVCETVEHVFPELKAQVKWPNDVLVDGKKISGTLVESTIASSGARAFIVGVGVNFQDDGNTIENAVGSQSVRFPASWLPSVNADDQLSNFLVEFYTRFNFWLERLAGGEVEQVTNAIGHRQWGIDRLTEIELPDGQRLTGTQARVDSAGRLVLTVSGDQRAFVSATIISAR